MDWSNIAVELLENILIYTASPEACIRACMACKNWSTVGQDAHFWKALYQSLSWAPVNDESADWKTKVLDLVLVRKNIQNGRCVVRTVATAKNPSNRSLLEFDNYSLYKDHCIIGWQEIEHFGSYSGVYRTNSSLINTGTGDVETLPHQNILFVNHYIAKTPSLYYGSAAFSDIKVLDFNGSDPKNISFKDNVPNPGLVKFDVPEKTRSLLTNFSPDSNYIGFWSTVGREVEIFVVDGQSGKQIWSTRDSQSTGADFHHAKMCDKYVAVTRENNLLQVFDVTTQEEKQMTFKSHIALLFVKDTTVALRNEDKVVLWNFKTDEITQRHVGQIPMRAVNMITYHDMWLAYNDDNLSFFDMKDGSLINSLAFSTYGSAKISVLSDGRIAVAQTKGCQVVSFVDSEVNRVINVEVLDEQGTTTSHKIPAWQLVQFFESELQTGKEQLTSQILSTAADTPDEHSVLIFAQISANISKTNETATNLRRQATQLPQLSTPYLPWTFGTQPIQVSNFTIEKVCGKALIVKEKKIDGRWQLL